jgi:hypothetical protein
MEVGEGPIGVVAPKKKRRKNAINEHEANVV